MLGEIDGERDGLSDIEILGLIEGDMEGLLEGDNDGEIDWLIEPLGEIEGEALILKLHVANSSISVGVKALLKNPMSSNTPVKYHPANQEPFPIATSVTPL